MRKFVTLARLLFALVYSRHVGYQFMPDILDRPDIPVDLPPGYTVRQPPDPGDEVAIAALLNEDPGYGTWTDVRVLEELYARMATPLSACLLLYEGVPVGVAFAIDASTRWRRMAHGTYLYLQPAHRARGRLALLLVCNVLRVCFRGGYSKFVAYTDPDRYSALLLYLSMGVRPLYDSLSSFWYWHRIMHRLGPALRRAEAQRERRETMRGTGLQAPRHVTQR